jgi:hypothetical protein
MPELETGAPRPRMRFPMNRPRSPRELDGPVEDPPEVLSALAEQMKARGDTHPAAIVRAAIAYAFGPAFAAELAEKLGPLVDQHGIEAVLALLATAELDVLSLGDPGLPGPS